MFPYFSCFLEVLAPFACPNIWAKFRLAPSICSMFLFFIFLLHSFFREFSGKIDTCKSFQKIAKKMKNHWKLLRACLPTGNIKIARSSSNHAEIGVVKNQQFISSVSNFSFPPKFCESFAISHGFQKNKRNGFLSGSYFSLFLETLPRILQFSIEGGEETRT